MALTAAAHSYSRCSGPAALPAAVMRHAPAEFGDFQCGGSGIIEMPHRFEAFLAVLTAAEANLRHLLTLSEAWRIRLF